MEKTKTTEMDPEKKHKEEHKREDPKERAQQKL
jgi:hypothetical protein